MLTMTRENPISVVEENSPGESTADSNSVSVNMQETIGAFFLGIVATISLIGWMRAEARYRALIAHTR